ncbi:MAG: hypothetical protein RI945_146 [Candidatus Parcubacteria bacterium]|jgi:methionyl-tRNA synthetase
MKKTFYLTTTLPYVNADPHIGFAMEIIRGDVIARYKRYLGYEVFFNTGTDEHGQKLFEAAKEAGIDTQKYVDQNAIKFIDLMQSLNISNDTFIRTTEERHIKSALAIWNKCKENGFIYKKNYAVKYCVGCELEKQDSELNENGRCELHPNRDLEIREEENYFFAFSKFESELTNYYENNPNFVVPDFRFNEIKSFVKNGLQDFSISRLKSKMNWGIPVPGDEEHVMYVWFDALTNYISTLGWGSGDESNFEKFWLQKDNERREVVQYCGKDNLRQQSAIWQAMLMAAGIPNSTNIIIDGFITGEGGVKMSKSLGNAIDPLDIINEYGVDALRYFLLKEVSSFEDSPFTIERFKESYNSGLVNGLGNLTSRILTMSSNYGVTLSEEDLKMRYYTDPVPELEGFDICKHMNNIWVNISNLNKFIQEQEPFKKIKINKEEAEKDVHYLLYHLFGIALALEPMMPETSLKIQELIKENKKPEEPLFPRKD